MSSLFDKNIIDDIGKKLKTRGETIAVAESVTSGLVQLALGSADEAIQFFQGGITAYNIGQKSRHLLIEPIHAVACNCVSQRVAEEMAANVCALFNSDWGLGITGYASPVPESDNKVFCYYAIVHNNDLVVSEKLDAEERDTLEVQSNYAGRLLAVLLKKL